ncbi:malto-oligosyltrehalose trehalohydrolase [Iamia majanohamensis]|uniref:Malto-oligosyltrehalose trehalohydrolase n=1 Tax=Iamia majanohamensis TaxID=467976 RepID=A0AAF0BX38_9ACTN|nr:malto-oligosyltrehalose trehalohydrolase [Iamia majanohamensis]WCO68199.1 malto-oligosyltrehalose trehalohydrolase [Iamia majanohamensis]
MSAPYPWERPLGATPDLGGTTFRAWAPAAAQVAVRLADGDHPLAPAGHGVWEATVAEAGGGDDYRIVLDGTAWPDPHSRWQPEGVRGPSRVVDPADMAWTDGGWTPPDLADLVLYELHVGTFSEEGTFDGAIPHLAALADLGVTAIELMPVAEFPGTRGWGYDGVFLGAAQSSYGGPHALARLVDAAHAAGLGVVLDVVHNHLGPTGADAMTAHGPFFTDTYATPWGAALNYDDALSDPVREWVLQSVGWWLGPLHLDGLRLDAVHALFDRSAQHIVAAVAERAHRTRPGALVIAESGLNDPKVIRPPAEGGWGCDAQWADDLHHALRVLLTGDADGYYADFGSVADLAKALHRPFVHDGQWSDVRRRRFGAPAEDRPPEQFVVFTQDHDQVGNRALGDRPPRETRPLAALLTLLSPFTPMLFQGEEHGEDAPFQFFTDHIDPAIAEATRQGRRREFAAFAAFSGEEVPDPQDPATFARSKLTRREDPHLAALYRTLLRTRGELPPGDAEVTFDEDERWLRMRRGPYEVVANLSRGVARTLPTSPTQEVAVPTHPEVALADGRLTLPALGGALLREADRS